MIVERAERKFEPIIITIESKDEFDHLVVALNTTAEVLNKQKGSLNMDDFKPKSVVYGPMFNNLYELRRQGKI